MLVETVNITVVFSTDSFERLKKLCKKTGSDNARVMANSLRLYETAIAHLDGGGKAVLRNTDGTEVNLLES